MKIQGGSRARSDSVAKYMKPFEGKPIEARTIHALDQVQKNQTYEAEYVTTGPQPPGGTARPARIRRAGHLEPVRNGPPFLLVGADITAMTDNVTRGTLDLRLINNDFGGYRSECAPICGSAF